MDEEGGDQAGEVAKGLPTIRVLVGSFPGVAPLVSPQAVSPAEGLAALGASMWLLLECPRAKD